jgi:dolichyl-diphosphooligosaccharide--protein glycosyltransferase
VKKFHEALLIIGILLAVMLLTIYVRSASVDVKITDQWAANSLHNNLVAQVTAQVQSEYPNLPLPQIQSTVEERIKKLYANQQDWVYTTLNTMSLNFKDSVKDSDKGTYLLSIDPYLYLRRVELILQTGSVCDTTRNGQCWSTLTRYPIGDKINNELHPSFSVFVIKTVHKFRPDLSDERIFFYIPVMLACLAIIPAFFIGRKFAGLLGGTVTSIMVSLAPHFVNRSMAGYSDTDPYIVLILMTILWVFFEAMSSRGPKKHILLIITSALVGLFAFAWIGWWFILYALIGALAIDIVYRWIADKKFPLVRIITAVVFILLCLLFVKALVPDFTITWLIHSPASRTSSTSAVINKNNMWPAAFDVWPNIYLTVAELQKVNYSQIFATLGPKILVALGLAGLVILLYRKDEALSKKDYLLLGAVAAYYLAVVFLSGSANNALLICLLLIIPVGVAGIIRFKDKVDVIPAAMLLLLFVGFMYVGKSGNRFMLVIGPVYGLLLGIVYGRVLNMPGDSDASEKMRKILFPIIIIALLISLVPQFNLAIGAWNSAAPEFNDVWKEALTKIQTETPNNSVITSWWDYGHWFKYYAKRPVIIDGVSQNTPMTFFVSRALVTSNEEESIGWLRMLNCGSFKAQEYYEKQLNDPVLAYQLLQKVVSTDRANASGLLINAGVDQIVPELEDDSQIKYLGYGPGLLQLTHCNAPPAYLILDGSMVDKAVIWGHFGMWDPAKAHIYVNRNDNDIISNAMEYFNISESDASNLVFEAQGLSGAETISGWIAPYEKYFGDSNCTISGNTTSCVFNENIGPNYYLLSAVVQGSEQKLVMQSNRGVFDAKPAAFIVDGIRTDYSNPDLPMIVVINGNRAVVSSQNLATSMFSKLFFFDGAGTTHFKKFYEGTQFTGRRIQIWEVLW